MSTHQNSENLQKEKLLTARRSRLDKTDFSAEDQKRFYLRVMKLGDSECWPWSGAKLPNGYGVFYMKKRRLLSHRVALCLSAGEIPEDMCACHSCDNRECCNPSHLWIGTINENNLDRKNKGRSATGSRNGMNTTPSSRSFGERNGQSVLDMNTVVEIIKLRMAGMSLRKIAARFCVVKETIRNIVTGKTWTKKISEYPEKPLTNAEIPSA